MRSFAAVVALALAAAPAPAPEPSPVVTAAPAPASSPSAAPTPTAAPLPAPSPTATPSPSPFHYVIDPPPPSPGSPGILEIDVSDRVLHPGGPYVVQVTTTADVTGVQVQAMGGGYALPPAGPGRFFVSGSVPSFVPFFFLDRSYTLTVIASTADGRSASIQVPMRLER